MLDPEANQKRESAAMSGFARFGGLDQLDWLMIRRPFCSEPSPSNTIFWIYPIGFWNGYLRSC